MAFVLGAILSPASCFLRLLLCFRLCFHLARFACVFSVSVDLYLF